MAYQAEIEKLEGRFREKPEQWFAALADAYRKSGDVDMALEVLNAWIDKRPSYTSGHIVLGRCHLDKQQDAVAAEAFEKVLELDMENVIALKSLSEIAERTGDSQGARRWLQRLLEVDPMNEEATEALERLGEGAGVEAEDAGAAAEPAAPVDVEQAAEAFGAVDFTEPLADQPMPATGFEATELESPAEFDSKAVAGFEPTGSVEEEPISIPMDEDSMLKADAIPEEVEPALEEVSVEDLAPIAGAEPPAVDEPKTLSIPDTVPEGFEAIEIEPDVEFAPPPMEAAHEPDPELLAPVDDTLTDESALVMGPALEALEREGAEQAAEATEEAAAEVAGERMEGPAEAAGDLEAVEPPEEAGFAFGSAREGEEVVEAAASEPAPALGDVELKPDTVDAAADRPSAAVPIEFVEPVVEEPEPKAPVVEQAAVPAEAVEPAEVLPLIVPESAAPEQEIGQRPPEPEPVITETMAELYASQGLYDDAAAVYRELLVQRPDDRHLLAKLEELERTATPVAPGPEVSGGLATPAAGGQTVRAMLEDVIAGIGMTPTIQPTETTGGEGGVELSEPSATSSDPPAPAEDVAPSDFSFDEFFGSGAEPAPSPEPEQPAEPEEPKGAESKDFKDWLKGLKT